MTIFRVYDSDEKDLTDKYQWFISSDGELHYLDCDRLRTLQGARYVVCYNEDNPDANLDHFYLNEQSGTVKMIYYNPDSDCGGQFVISRFDAYDIIEAAYNTDEPDCLQKFFSYLDSVSRVNLADIGTEWFSYANAEYEIIPDLVGRTDRTMQRLINFANDYV